MLVTTLVSMSAPGPEVPVCAAAGRNARTAGGRLLLVAGRPVTVAVQRGAVTGSPRLIGAAPAARAAAQFARYAEPPDEDSLVVRGAATGPRVVT